MTISDSVKNKVITVDNLNEFYAKFKDVLAKNYLSSSTFQQFTTSYGNMVTGLSQQISTKLDKHDGITVISTELPTKLSNIYSVVKSYWPQVVINITNYQDLNVPPLFFPYATQDDWYQFYNSSTRGIEKITVSAQGIAQGCTLTSESWNDVTSKPFSTVGAGLSVNSDNSLYLDVNTIAPVKGSTGATLGSYGRLAIGDNAVSTMSGIAIGSNVSSAGTDSVAIGGNITIKTQQMIQAAIKALL